MGRLVRVATVSTLTAVLQCTPAAQALSPPPIDDALLPAAAPAAPSRPTVQREPCTVPGFDPQSAVPPGQLDGLDLQSVWPLTRGAGQRVAVIDTGVSRHRRLPGLVGGGDYVSTGDGAQDCDGHGTVAAGIIAARPDPATDRFSGVAPESTVIGIRQSSGKFGVFRASESGVGDVDTLAKAVRTAADLNAAVINISAVACAPADPPPDDRSLGAALAYAVDVKNAVVVAAAGNTDDSRCRGRDDHTGAATVVVSPAWYDDYVLTVGSVTSGGAPSDFTLPGPWVDVAAPGEAVLSLSPVGDAMANTSGQRESKLYGTGFAASVVSGLAALIRARFPDWTPRQVMARIKATARHPAGGRNDFVGDGLIDPLAAVSTGTPVSSSAPGFDGAAKPVAPPPGPVRAPAPAGRRRALAGAGFLLAALLVMLAARPAVLRLLRPGNGGAVHGDGIPGD